MVLFSGAIFCEKSGAGQMVDFLRFWAKTHGRWWFFVVSSR